MTQPLSHYQAARTNLRAVGDRLNQIPEGRVPAAEVTAHAAIAQALALAAIAEAILTLKPEGRS